MKWFDIALKDLKYTFKNVFSLAMMLGAPLLVTGLLYFAFGGLAGGEGDFNLPASQVLVVNLDQGSSQFGSFHAGDMFVTFLEDEEIGDLLEISQIEDERSARALVEQGEADIAVIVPPNFTAAALTPGERAKVSLYQDPTLTIAPGILEDLLNHFMDGFSGAKIAANVTAEQLRDHQIMVDESLSRDIVSKYAGWLESSGHNEGQGTDQVIQITSPKGGGESADLGAAMIGPIMAGMLVFFLFFMAANGAQAVIREHEQGTLARLFTTPTSQPQILGGKFVSVFLTITIQAVLLLAVSSALFSIQWGQLWTVTLVTAGLLVVAAGFGILVMSFVQNTRQTGPVLGGVLTITGMLGGLFTNGIPNLPEALGTARLAMPQGWAMRAWELSLAGAAPNEVLLPVLVMLGLGAVFFGIGALIFHRRFA